MTTPPDISEAAVEKHIIAWRDTLPWDTRDMLRELRSALTARDDALASIRVFAQDCIENGYFDKGALGNLYSIRDLCDSKGETK